jgi:hypothetical protein
LRKVLCLAGLFVLVSVQLAIYARYQPQIAMGNGRGDDGVFYGLMAEQAAQGRPLQADAPFVYRIGTPWLVGQLSRWTPLSVDEAFRAVNLVGYFVLILLLYLLALRFCSPPYAAFVCLLYSLPFYGYARVIFFYPVHVDTLWYILVLGALLLMLRSHCGPGTLALLVLLSVLATLVRETGIVIPLIFLLSRDPFRRLFAGPPAGDSTRRLELMGGLAMLAGSLLAIGLTHLVVEPTGAYTFLAAASESVRLNAVWHVVVAFYLGCGGALLGVFLIQLRPTGLFFRTHPELSAFAALFFLLAFVGGVDTVRFFSWAAPALLIAIAVGVESLVVEARTVQPAIRFLRYGLLVALLTVSLLTLHPFGGYYDDYSDWLMWGGMQGSRMSSLLPVLGGFLAMGIVGLLWKRIGNLAGARPS